MKNPTLNVFALFAVALKESLYKPLDFCADHLRNVLGQQDMEAGIAKVEAHGAEGIREGVSFRDEHARAGSFFSSDDYGGGSVSKQNGGDQIGLRNVFPLEGERGQLHGDDQHVRLGIRLDIVRGTRDGHGAGGATKFGERHAPNIGAKSHQLDEVRVKGRNHEAGTGNSDDQIDFVWPETSLLQALFGGFPAKLYGVLNVFVVGFAEGTRFNRIVDRENGVALVHLGVVHDGHHSFHAPVRDLKDPSHVIFNVIARDKVWGQSSGRRRDRGNCGIPIRRDLIRQVHIHRPPLGIVSF